MNCKSWMIAAILATLAQSGTATGIETFDACLTKKSPSEEAVRHCLLTSLEECITEPADVPAVATVCFRDNGSAYETGLKETIASVTSEMSEKNAVILRIDLKYELLAGLLQCDRLEELGLAVSDLSSEVIQRTRAQCEAMAVGLLYGRLQVAGTKTE